MVAPREPAPTRNYVEPRIIVHGSVQRITRISSPLKYVEKHPLKPGSKLRPK